MIPHSRHGLSLYLLILCAALVGCASGPRPEPTGFEPVDLRPELAAGHLVPAVDRYLIVLDASGSMGDAYRGRSKLEWAKTAAARIHQGRTGLPIPGAIRTVGDALSPFDERTALVLDFSGYGEPGAFSDALAEVDSPVGRSVLGNAIRAAGADLAGTGGRTALILVTDGLAEDDPVAAAADLAAAMGDAICIHGIWIGPEGHGLSTLEDVVRVGGCGRVAMVEELETPEGVAGKIEEMFLAAGTPKPEALVEVVGAPDGDRDGVPDGEDRCPDTPPGTEVGPDGCTAEPAAVRVAPVRPAAMAGDADGDGVPDGGDRCAGTPAGVRVNADGCWIIGAILFGTDRTAIRPEYYTTLDEVVSALRDNPRLDLALQGHADARGDASYNMDLSRRRAEAVAAYLKKAGISPDRMLAVGYGISAPVAPNDTADGRAENRRVELAPLRVMN